MGARTAVVTRSVPRGGPVPSAGTDPGPGRRFDAAVVLAGLVLAALSLGRVVASGLPDPWLLLVVPVVGLMASFPLSLSRTGEGVEIGFDCAVLVLLATTTPPLAALALWVLGVAAAQVVSRRRSRARAFNAGLATVAGATALGAMTAVGGLGLTVPRELLAVLLGSVVYFVVDYALSSVSVRLEAGEPLPLALPGLPTVVALAVFVASTSSGYLAALVLRVLPRWAAVLMLVPVVTMLVAAHALSRGNEHRRRLAALFGTAAAVQVPQTRSGLLETLREHAGRVVLSDRLEVRQQPPRRGEVGARVGDGEGGLWFVAPARHRARSSVQADQQALHALAAVATDALARLRLLDETVHLARHDVLTGLANRSLFLDRVQHAVALSRRSGRPVAVVFLDLDGFKAVNDRFGHEAGDELLVEVAHRITDCLRESDSVARLGGDEFAVLVEDVVDVAGLELVCAKLLGAFGEDVVVADHEVAVGASIGVAVSTADDDADALLRNADMAMYRAKALGKGRYAFYEPSLRAENIRRLELIDELRRDVATQLVVHYQPVVDLTTRSVDGVEALVRWRRDGQLVGPDDFIEVAEESGLVVDIGDVVLARVVEDACRLEAAAGRPLSIAVNVSANQLREPGFVERVGAARRALGGRLVLEMTEHVFIGDDDETSLRLRELAETGATLAIDDFGVGYSSIGYLQHLPVEMLKIDRSFTADVDLDERAATLVEAMVLMGNALGLRVVAEGIERDSQLERLRGVGCTTGQGFLFAKGLPLQEVVALLAAERARTHREPPRTIDVRVGR